VVQDIPAKVSNIQIGETVVVIVTRSHAHAVGMALDARVFGDIGKRAVAVVAEKNVVSPETAKQVIPSIVVVIAYADTGLPTGTRQP